MSDILRRAKAHYSEKLNKEMRIVEVPEWGDDKGPLKIFVKPANLTVRDKIYKHVANGSLEALVETIILRAKDSDGLSIFTSGDKQALMNQVDPDVIARIASEISEDLDLSGDESYEDAVKN